MIYTFKGKTPKIHPTAFLTPSSDVIGDVEIGENASLWFNVSVRGDVNYIRIGANTNVQDGSVLHVTELKSPHQAPLIIEDNVTIGHKVTLHGCTVKKFALIGMGAIIIDHAVVGEEVLVGAGAFIKQGMIIPPRVLVLGSPARVVRDLKPEEIAFLHQSPQNYIETARMYRESGFPEVKL